MIDARMKNKFWNVSDDGVRSRSVEHAQLAVLMDLREELQKLNRVFQCHNFQDIPRKLDAIRRNTKRPARKKAKR